MQILALDLGANLGWAIIDNGMVWASGTYVFEGTRVTRAAATLEKLYGFNEWEFDVVVYERPFARGRDATRCLWGLAGIVEACFGAGAAVLDVENQTLKAWATGNRKASKTQMKDAVRRRVGYKGPLNYTEHEADAILLGLYTHEKAEVEA